QPDWMSAIVQYPRIFQGWGMFSPDAPLDDGTVVIDAITVDGRHIDPLTHQAPVFDVLPPRGVYPMQPQWCDYFNRIRLPGNAVYRDQFRSYILRLWALERRPPEDRLMSFDVYWVSRMSPKRGEMDHTPVRKEKVISYP